MSKKPSVLSVKREGIPAEMAKEVRWMPWKLVRRGEKWTKVPYGWRGKRLGSSTDQTKWGTLDAVMDVYGMDGVGFALGGGWFGVDLDGAFEGGGGSGDEGGGGRRLRSWAKGIVDRFSGLGVYWERSVGGLGLHGIGRGGGWIRTGLKRPGVEIYGAGRYFTVTGHRVGPFSGFGGGDDVLKKLYVEYGGVLDGRDWGKVEVGIGESGCIGGDEWIAVGMRLERWFPDAGIVEMLEGDGGLWGRLWAGRWEDDYPSQSEADMALLGHLTRFCGPDAVRVERLFSQSGLGARDKWRERADYRGVTVGKAVLEWMKGSAGQAELMAERGEEVDKIVRGVVSSGEANLKKAAGDAAKAVVRAAVDRGVGSAEARRRGAEVRKGVKEIGKGWRKVGDFVRGMEGGIVKGCLENVRVAINRAGMEVRHNQLTDKIELGGSGEMVEEIRRVCGDADCVFTDAVLTWIRNEMESRFRVTFGVDNVRAMVQLIGRENGYHPVLDYLGGLEWDGVRRIDQWLVDYAGARNDAFVRACGALTLIAAVRRVRVPGVKFDEMLILEGAQGSGKSSLWRVMAGDEWFSDSIDLGVGVGGREFVEMTEGAWIIEAAELASFRRGDHKRLKGLLSQQADKCRRAYGYMSERRKRQFILVGTTNETEYLEDPTGGRRYWPVAVGEIDLEGLERNRDQLWAEAAAREREGESIRLEKGLWKLAGVEQDKRLVKDPWEEILARELGGVSNGRISSVDVFDLIGVPGERQTPTGFTRLKNIMKRLGWRHGKVPIDGFGRRLRGYLIGKGGNVLEPDGNGGVQIKGEEPF